MAARMMIWAVSSSRISPTRIASGSSGSSAAPRANEPGAGVDLDLVDPGCEVLDQVPIVS